MATATMQAMEAARLVDSGRTVWVRDGSGNITEMTRAFAKAIRGFGFQIVASEDREALGSDWWIQRPEIQGGDIGPFATRDLALTVRQYVEGTAQGRTYSVAPR